MAHRYVLWKRLGENKKRGPSFDRAATNHFQTSNVSFVANKHKLRLRLHITHYRKSVSRQGEINDKGLTGIVMCFKNVSAFSFVKL